MRWTCKSTYKIAEALQGQGHRISQRSVYALLKEEGYSLQSNRKLEEGTQHPDRDAPFQPINRLVKRFQRRGQPVISVDAKKENIGNFAKAGQEWERHEQFPPGTSKWNKIEHRMFSLIAVARQFGGRQRNFNGEQFWARTMQFHMT